MTPIPERLLLHYLHQYHDSSQLGGRPVLDRIPVLIHESSVHSSEVSEQVIVRYGVHIEQRVNFVPFYVLISVVVLLSEILLLWHNVQWTWLVGKMLAWLHEYSDTAWICVFCITYIWCTRCILQRRGSRNDSIHLRNTGTLPVSKTSGPDPNEEAGTSSSSATGLWGKVSSLFSRKEKSKRDDEEKGRRNNQDRRGQGDDDGDDEKEKKLDQPKHDQGSATLNLTILAYTDDNDRLCEHTVDIQDITEDYSLIRKLQRIRRRWTVRLAHPKRWLCSVIRINHVTFSRLASGAPIIRRRCKSSDSSSQSNPCYVPVDELLKCYRDITQCSKGSDDLLQELRKHCQDCVGESPSGHEFKAAVELQEGLDRLRLWEVSRWALILIPILAIVLSLLLHSIGWGCAIAALVFAVICQGHKMISDFIPPDK